MNKTEQVQAIKRSIMADNDCNVSEAVEIIAGLVNRSPLTVYEYLSIGRPDIPDNTLELLRLKL